LTSPILCIGSALWDIIARTGHPLAPGRDLPGRITHQPGGVALNIALALARQGSPVALLSVIGLDPQGVRLVDLASAAGIDCTHLIRGMDPTDSYLAIEDAAGEVFGAIADCAALERVGAAVLAPLRDGRLGSPQHPFRGLIVIDGNLPEPVLAALVQDPAFGAARLSFVPASPGKAARLRGVLATPGGSFYVNRTEAEILAGRDFSSAAKAARALVALGAARAVVTNGPRKAAIATAGGVLTCRPPRVAAHSTTGAGDAFLAAHLAAEARGLTEEAALHAAVAAAAEHISRRPAP